MVQSIFNSLNSFLGIKSDPKTRYIISFVKNLTGKKPKNISLYLLALRHTSMSADKAETIINSNERLEFLGDAVLGAVIAEYLYKKYPFKDEGFMTDIRSRIVNGEALNMLARRIGLNKLVEYNSRNRTNYAEMYGDAMEAFIGTLYLDRGYKFTRSFIINILLVEHIDLDKVLLNDNNYKSKIINWAQGNRKSVSIDIIAENGDSQTKIYTAEVKIDDIVISVGKASSKKKAEQDAARKACIELSL